MKISFFSLAAIIMLAACAASSPPNHYYLLTPVAASASQSTVIVAQIVIPAYLDRAQIVRRDGAELKMDEFERWGESFDSMVRRVLAADIAAQPATGTERSAKIIIDDFTADETGNVRLQAHWIFTGKKVAPPVFSFAQTVSIEGSGNTALAAAMSDLLRQLAVAMTQTE